MKISRWIVVAAAALFAPVAIAQPKTTRRFSPREIAQGYADGAVLAKPLAAQTSDLAAAEAREGRSLRKIFPQLGDLRVLAPAPNESVADAVTRLRATGRYEFVEPDYIKHPLALPDDPRFTSGEQWYLRNTGQDGGTSGADIGATAAWNIRSDASSVIVAIIDTGIHATHEDLAANLWTNPAEIPNNGIDDDNNGYVDDVHGINSIAALRSRASGDPDDDVGHGTFVAGLIGAVGNNTKGITGVAWKVKLMALKFDDAEGSATTSNEIECIDYAIAKGAQIINISYGDYFYSQSEYDAIKRAKAAGIVIVAAAGNDSVNTDTYPVFPASYLLDNVVAVGATDRRDALSSFSNYSTGSIELGAPGSDILSTSYTDDDAYVTRDGTSFSAPLTVGALALLRAQFPTEVYRGAINRLLRSVDPIAGLAGKSQTGGRLNIGRALASTSNRPFNDDFAARVALTGSSVLLRASNQYASAETGEPAHAGLTAGATVWWSWTAPRSGSAAIETTGSDFDTVLAAYTGSSVSALGLVASNDDNASATTSRISFTAVAGTTYQIAVGGKNNASGGIVLTVGFVPTNDQFASATVLSGFSLRIPGSTALASSETSEPKAVATAKNRSVWYRWVAPTTDYYSFSVFAYGFDAVGAIYTGTTLATLHQVESTSTTLYNEPATFWATFGTTYYFQVDSADGNTGVFDVTVIDGIGLANVRAVDPSPAYSPKTGYLSTADAYGYITGVNFDTGDFHSDVLAGSLDVQSPAIAPDGSMFIGDDLGYLYAYDATLGRKWRKDLGYVVVTSSPAIGADGAVYVHTDDGLLQAFFSDGSLKWRTPIPGDSYSSPSIGADGTIYIGSSDASLYAIAPTNGAIKWRFLANGPIYSSPAIDASGALYFGTLNGNFYSVTSAGVQRWVYSAGGPISSSAAIATDGTVYFGCYDTKVYALTSTGALRWTYATGDEIRASSPAIASDGTIYIGSYDGYIHAIYPSGFRRRVYVTGGYVRSSPLIFEKTLFIGSGDARLYAIDIGADLASSPWPMHRQNVRHTGRQLLTTAPAIVSQPLNQANANGSAAVLALDAEGADTLAFQWQVNGSAISGATNSSYNIAAVSPADAGIYTAVVTNASGTMTSTPVIVGVTTSTLVTGTNPTFYTDLPHPNGNRYDQVLLTTSAQAMTTQGRTVRTSFIDASDDIVQVEFAGAGTLSVVLDGPTGPAAPINYTQPTVAYMKGRAGLVITGADESTNISVFTVGRATAFDPNGHYNIILPAGPDNDPATNGSPLFVGHETTNYDGIADIAFIAISSTNGKFGGIRTANARFSAAKGYTGIYAPGVHFVGPVNLEGINASGTGIPVLMIDGADGGVRITGGNLKQDNSAAIRVAGVTRLLFVAGATSGNRSLPAQANQGRLVDSNGTDVTSSVVVPP
jgi:subtilisin family serine protease/outer membrane protein assembly factor BamB